MKKRELKKIEAIEKAYFDEIVFCLTQGVGTLDINRLIKTKEDIRSDWENVFKNRIKKAKGKKKKKIISEIARGAERIFYWLMPRQWIPNSCPIAADMFFETRDAFVHIDIKTCQSDNTSDYKGRLAVGNNQNSFFNKTKNKSMSNLPTVYKKGNKLCLTYAIQIINDTNSSEILAIVLICVPNGKLRKYYSKCIVSGKAKEESIRYYYHKQPKFILLDDKPYRMTTLYFNDQIKHFKENRNFLKKDITNLIEVT